ncbi:MAG: hypothetical protein KA954_06520 [Chitinophagales bacterium]|nr:hypothetical protein [Bacteroidota bacterium]MBP7399220.1 hypothetical protein [Chitinophagales bacterium]MBK8488688.1 hypothetical protein [Bacteroidota bacterium]MBK8681556.1 hypothetical protein [Bacteroidota bacterium]MBP8753029.1 hypothetical protein [Chitinophagales bacterium]
MELNTEIIICPFCGMPAQIVWVHGHGQCSICKMVLDECCRGEQQTEKDNQNKKIDENKNKNDE